MNRLKAKIELINSHDELLLIELNVQRAKIIAIIIGRFHDYSYLEIGNEIVILFKENKVIILKNKALKISIKNKLASTISSMLTKNLLSQIKLNFIDFTLSSIITARSIQNLNLKPQDIVTALIKPNEMILSEC